MIKGTSFTFKTNCKKDKIKYREYIIIDNKQVDIKGNLSATAYKDTTFFGTFNMKMLKFETENDINYKKKEFVYYKEVNGEAIKIGTFIVTEVKDSDTFESVNVTAYDYGLKFANPYTTTLDYANGDITLFQQIQEICTNCEVEFENTTLPNGSFIIDSNQFVNGEQYGDVIAQASGINGMFATINSNDKLEFIFQNETDEIIEDYVELDDKRDTHPITSVLVATSEDLETAGAVMKDETLIEQYGEHWLKIYSYGYAYSTKKCQDLVSAIFNLVKGFSYSSFKSEYSFLPYLSLGDKIQFRNKDGKLVNSIILKYETSYDEITFEAPSIIDASVEYELPETPENIAKKAIIEVNQAKAEINFTVNDVEKIKNNINNDYYTKETTNKLIENASQGLINIFTQSGGNNLLRNTAPYFMESDNTAEFWKGNVKQGREENSTSGFALLLQDNTITQNVTLKKATYTIKFFYKKLISLSKLKVEYNGRIIEIDDTSIKLNGETLVFTDGKYETESILIDTNEKSIKTTGEVSTGNMILKITCDTNNGFEIYDLMLNFGDVFIPWSQNANESTSDTVNISKGITVSSNTTNTVATMKSDGFKVRNKTTDEEVMSTTDTGGLFKDITSTGVSKLSGLIIQQIGDEIWITGGAN